MRSHDVTRTWTLLSSRLHFVFAWNTLERLYSRLLAVASLTELGDAVLEAVGGYLGSISVSQPTSVDTM